jgi:S1-C subfamily serine protease
MKRTLLEVLGGLTVLVLLFSFNQQIAKLKIQDKDFARIRTMVESAVDSKEEIQQARLQLLARFQGLEQTLAATSRDTQQALALKREIEAAQEEVERITDGFLETKDLVNTYLAEAREKEVQAQAIYSKTQESLASLAEQITPDTVEMTRSMLAPTVQLNGEDTVGSGTLVFSGTNSKNGKIESYVLTSYHVVRNILSDLPRSRRDKGIDVTIYLGEKRIDVKGEMEIYNATIDAALVKLKTDRIFPNVARTLPKPLQSEVNLWDPVIAVGCPLGNDPVPTNGSISSLANVLSGSNYWMINAPTYFGNSGGGVYLADSHQLIGVFSKIYTHGKGNPVVIPHMGLCTPIGLVHDWLAEKEFGHLLEYEVAVAAPGK